MFTEIKNKLQKSALKNFTHVELKVNDMWIIASKENGKWEVKIFHENKDTHKRESYTTPEIINYLNAYIETARTKIHLLRK